MSEPTGPEPGASRATGPLAVLAPPLRPADPVVGADDAVPAPPAHRSSYRPLQRLRRRSDFLAAARARRQSAPAFTLQARDRGDDGAPRVGFTCSRRVGNAVARNRARRRLREAARLVLPGRARSGWDYVLIGRPETTATRPFEALLDDLRRSMERLHR